MHNSKKLHRCKTARGWWVFIFPPLPLVVDGNFGRIWHVLARLITEQEIHN